MTTAYSDNTSTDSSLASDSSSNAPISAQAVANYLLDNSDFFAQHPEILAELSLPHNSGSAVSLMERQVAILRETSIQTRHKLSEFIQAAKENDSLLQTTQSLIIDLINCRSLTETFEMVEEKLAMRFGVESVGVLLISDADAASHGLDPRFHQLQADADNAIAGILQNKTPLCGTLRDSEAEFIFSNSQYAIGSAAITSLPISHKATNSTLLLAVAHHDSHHYDSETGTLFLDYLAEILVALINRLNSVE
ncbi:MAG TPA: DUF484 domain-containing protein [Cellvibrionales bacterium]|nr:DUF484 domain-containing protein [Cellvibrionales bacterium]